MRSIFNNYDKLLSKSQRITGITEKVAWVIYALDALIAPKSTHHFSYLYAT